VPLTGDTSAEDIAKTKEVGMQFYLEKPINVSEFYKLLYSILS
jgi:CheY-like chemotaxis protein